MSRVTVCDLCKSEFLSDDDPIPSFFAFELCDDCDQELQEFWQEHEDICGGADPRDINLLEFIDKHHNVIDYIYSLEDYLDRKLMVHTLMGDYYINGFDSRSASGYIAEIFQLGDYLNLYCGSSTYADVRFFNIHSKNNNKSEHIAKLLEGYDQANNKDKSK